VYSQTPLFTFHVLRFEFLFELELQSSVFQFPVYFIRFFTQKEIPTSVLCLLAASLGCKAPVNRACYTVCLIDNLYNKNLQNCLIAYLCRCRVLEHERMGTLTIVSAMGDRIFFTQLS
jgi:hypothetical protein